MPDVTSTAPTEVRGRCALDIHKRSIVAAYEPEDPRDGTLELIAIANSERALRRLVRRLGGPQGLGVCYEAGPCSFAPYRLLREIGVACDVVARSLTPRQLFPAETAVGSSELRPVVACFAHVGPRIGPRRTPPSTRRGRASLRCKASDQETVVLCNGVRPQIHRRIAGRIRLIGRRSPPAWRFIPRAAV